MYSNSMRELISNGIMIKKVSKVQKSIRQAYKYMINNAENGIIKEENNGVSTWQNIQERMYSIHGVIDYSLSISFKRLFKMVYKSSTTKSLAQGF